MASFTYPDMTFEERKGEDGAATVRCRLFARYYFDLNKERVEKLGTVTITKGSLEFPGLSERKVWNKVGRLVQEGLDRSLIHQLYDKPTVYIREESGIPLIGSNEFGIVDRGSNILEVKPLTGCNFTCTYCSVDEGRNDKLYDYLVEEEYLVKVAAAAAATKTHPVEFNIGPHGEPLLYPKLVELVRDLKRIPNTEIISINTNGSLLSTKLIDDLAAAGLTRVNLSIPALDQRLADELAGIPHFPLKHILAMLDYGKTKIRFLLAPVLIPGKNEGEMKKLVELSTTISSEFPTIGIQNYLEYPKGRKPVKRALSWDEFFNFIKQLEKETGAELTATKEQFRIFDEQELPKPFRKGDVVEAELCMPGRYPTEMYARAKGRVTSVQLRNDPATVGKRVRVKLVRDKHNIYKGVPTRK
jgi:uncharacterized Fe-S cluster-containing radical SAM superfamily enzyme